MFQGIIGLQDLSVNVLFTEELGNNVSKKLDHTEIMSISVSKSQPIKSYFASELNNSYRRAG